jgi:hypothetical protein
MTQKMIDDLIGAVPPSTIDLDRIIRRVSRRRRFGASAAGAGGALVVAATMMVSGVLSGGDRLTVEAPTSSTVILTPTPTRFRIDTADPEETLANLQAAWEAALAAVAPDVAFVYMPDVPGEPPGPDAPSMHFSSGPGVIIMEGRPPQRLPGPAVFHGRAGISRDGHRAGLFLSLRSCEPDACQTPPSCASHTAGECATTTISGRAVVEFTERWPDDYLFYGTSIRLGAANYDLGILAVNYFGGDGTPPTMPAPLLTRSELSAIVSAIADQITP